jgi:hypothetical protein
MQPIFARLYKVDEETRTVYGRAAQETIDRDNELFDYKSSKPEFQKWSAEVFADSGGRSLGNVRSMHGNVAAGKLTDIQFLDSECAIDVAAKIVDDNEWKKCVEGVHTGFSIGGRYARKWAEPINGRMVTRYTAVPSEISIVDRPCIPTAKFDRISKLGFELRKRDGTVEHRDFLRSSRMSIDLKKAAIGFAAAFERHQLLKYSDDQPRDDHGRFGSGGSHEKTVARVANRVSSLTGRKGELKSDKKSASAMFRFSGSDSTDEAGFAGGHAAGELQRQGFGEDDRSVNGDTHTTTFSHDDGRTATVTKPLMGGTQTRNSKMTVRVSAAKSK